MGRLASKINKRIMAFALSIAMIMSNMTVYAGEAAALETQTEEAVVEEAVSEAAAEAELSVVEDGTDAADENRASQEDTPAQEAAVYEENNEEGGAYAHKEAEEASATVAEGTIEFTKNAPDAISDVSGLPDKGITVENITYNGDHGIVTGSGDSTIKMNLSGKANIAIQTCKYNNNEKNNMLSEVTASSGKILRENKNYTGESNEESQNLPRLINVVGASAGELTITFSTASVYIHTITVDYVEEDYYTITVENDGNGKATASPAFAKQGDEVTLTATPNSGYEFSEWEVTEDGVEISNNKFTMPAQDVKVSAKFKLMEGQDYLEDGTIDFGTKFNEGSHAQDDAVSGIRGLAVSENIKYHDAQHGLYTTAADATMTLKLEAEKKAKITVLSCQHSASAEMTAASGEDALNVLSNKLESLGGETNVPQFIIEEASGDVVLTFKTASIYIHSIKVEYIEDGEDTTYIASGTQVFTGDGHADIDNIKGLKADGIVYHDSDHGYKNNAENATIELNLEKKANVTVQSCQFNNSGTTMTASFGRVAVDKVGADIRFTVLSADAGKLTLTFPKKTVYIHSITVDYEDDESYEEKFIVTVTSAGHGSAEADMIMAKENDKVTLSCTADAGYVFDKWNVKSGTVTVADDNTFNMPKMDVEIEASFVASGPRFEWDFANDAKLTGENGVVLQNSDSEKTKDVAGLTVDVSAEGGKWDSTTDDGWVVVGKGTRITVPLDGVTAAEDSDGRIKVTVKGKTADYTVNGKDAARAEKAETFICEKGDPVVIEMKEDSSISYIKVEALEYVSAGTISFSNLLPVDVSKTFKGITLDETFDNNVNSHGIWTKAEDTEIALYLSENAKISVDTCCYGAGPAATMTASSGEVTKTERVEEAGKPAALTFGVTKAEKGILLLTFGNDVYIHSINVEYQKEVQEEYTEGIDVWDFGAEQLESTDTVKYNNKLTADIINSWYPDVKPGTTNKNLASFTVKDDNGNEDFLFNDGGYSTTHRLRTTNTALTRYDDKSLQIKDAESGETTTYTGYIYSNKSSDPKVYVGVRLNAGDIMTAVVSSNGNAYTITVEDPDGAKQNYSRPSGPSIITYYATKAGIHKIYNGTEEKLVVARVTRQHNQKIKISGKVELPKNAPDDLKLIFTCKESGAVQEAAITDGTYEVELFENYNYTIIADPTTYVVSQGADLELGKANETLTETHDVVIEAVNLHTLSGYIVGLDDDAIAKAKISIVKPADKLYIPKITIDKESKTYTAQLEDNVEYSIVTEGINDYELDSDANNNSDRIKIIADTINRNITYKKKPVYKVTIDPKGAQLSDLADADFTFKNLNEEGYEYTFKGPENIELRDGTYSVAVSNSGVFVQKLTTNLTIDGAPVTKSIEFNSNVTEWIFSEAEGFTEASCVAGSFKGLKLSGVNAESGKAHAIVAANGKVEIPVKGNCVVEATYYYAGKGTLGNVPYEATTSKDNTGKTDTTSYTYEGEGGYVELTASEKTYLTKIAIRTSVAYQAEITVDPSKDESATNFKTINAALEAIRHMERTEDTGVKPVTIKIQPGNYEEMLVIDTPNVKLVNAAGEGASIELRNKGVDIDKNAVRITSYYGHGYTYYSMDSNCKWNEEILETNKANGYPSFTNPGSGTTNNSYWNATVSINASNVSAEGIIFENSFNQYVSKKAAEDIIVKQSGAKEGSVPRASMAAGDTTVQQKEYVERAAALAIYNDCKQVYFDNCKFIGRQDTLYGGAGVTAGFYDCSVYGGTDYIFGGMTAVFAKCDLVFNTNDQTDDGVKNDVGYITAPQQKSGRGYLMWNCHVTSTVPGVDTASNNISKPGYFGRPWEGKTGEAVFYKTIVDAAQAKDVESGAQSMIDPKGWLDSLSGQSSLCQEYGTYEVSGVDNSSKRATWASLLTEEKLTNGEDIAVATFLGSWNPFADKDMAVVLPGEGSSIAAPAEPKAIVMPEPAESGDNLSIIKGATIVLSAEPGAKVYYNVNDNTDPTNKSTLYAKEITVGDENVKENAITIKAIAEKYNKTSSVATFTYKVTDAPAVAKPVFAPESGSEVKLGSRVTISAAQDAKIYYNINADADPTEKDTLYTGKDGIEITKENVKDNIVTIKAIAVSYGKSSDVETAVYNITVNAPTANYKSGTQFPDGGGYVVLSADDDADILYTMTTDGSEPADPTLEESAPQTYDKNSDGIKVTVDTVIKAAAKIGNKYSSVVTLKYKVPLSAPTADPLSGTVLKPGGGSVKLHADEGAVIYYTIGEGNTADLTNDKEGTTRKEYTGSGIPVKEDTVINAIAVKDDRFSVIVSFKYTIGAKPQGPLDEGLSIKFNDADADGNLSVVYTGAAIKPDITVTNNATGEELTLGVDYSVKYSNNVKASKGVDANKKPKVTVTGKGNLSGSAYANFEIEAMHISEEEVVTSDIIRVVKNKKITPAIYYGSTKLASGKDFQVTPDKITSAGESKVTVKGIGNFDETRTIDVKVYNSAADLKKDTLKFKVSIDKKKVKDALIYSGQPMDEAIEKCLTITKDAEDKDTEFKEGTQYEIVYPSDTVSAGTVKFSIVGLGNYSGCNVTKSVKILPKPVGDKVALSGSEKTDTIISISGQEASIPYTSSGAEFDELKLTDIKVDNGLVEGKDYKITYSSNKKVGSSAAYTITFMGNYKGKYKSAKFKITEAVLTDDNTSVIVPDMSGSKDKVYKSKPYVCIDNVLIKASEYTVEYYTDEALKTKMDNAHKVKPTADGTEVFVKIIPKANKNFKVGENTVLKGSYKVWLAPAASDKDHNLSKAKVNFYEKKKDTKKVTKVDYEGVEVYPKVVRVTINNKQYETEIIDGEVQENENFPFELRFVNNINKGAATVVVTPKDGSGMKGGKTATYKVVAKKLTGKW